MQAGLQMTIIMIQLQLKGEAIYILLGGGMGLDDYLCSQIHPQFSTQVFETYF
jgi:hypothetical protein